MTAFECSVVALLGLAAGWFLACVYREWVDDGDAEALGPDPDVMRLLSYVRLLSVLLDDAAEETASRGPDPARMNEVAERMRLAAKETQAFMRVLEGK